MTYYKLTRFSGIAPAVSSRLLGEQFAQTSQNIDFEAGRITPITEETTTTTLTASTRGSIYYYENRTRALSKELKEVYGKYIIKK